MCGHIILFYKIYNNTVQKKKFIDTELPQYSDQCTITDQQILTMYYTFIILSLISLYGTYLAFVSIKKKLYQLCQFR